MRPALLRVPGVADVVSYGGLVEEIHVEPDPTKMAALGVVLDDVFQRAAEGVGERVRRPRRARRAGLRDPHARHVPDRSTTSARCASASTSGVPVDGQGRRGGRRAATRRARAWSRAATNQDAVEGIVLMRRGENPSVVLEGVLRDASPSSRSTRCPTGVQDRARSTTAPISSTPRSTPCSTTSPRARSSSRSCCSCSCCRCARRSSSRSSSRSRSRRRSSTCTRAACRANLLSMGAVDFGIIVDGAVILVEHVFEHAAGRRVPAA